MKIVIATPFYLPDIGGIAHHVFNIFQQLSKKHDLKIITNTSKTFREMHGKVVVVGIRSVGLPPILMRLFLVLGSLYQSSC